MTVPAKLLTAHCLLLTPTGGFMRVGRDRSYYKSGFTIAELLIAMAVFALIAVMLAFPLLSALGYIEKRPRTSRRR